MRDGRTRYIVSAAIGFGALLVVTGTIAAQSGTILWPAEAIRWTKVAGTAGTQAVLWGDPATGGYGALKQVPAGTVLPPHTHKNDSRLLIVKGTVSFDIDGKKTMMPAGSYAMIPGGVVHAARCEGTAACEYFEEMSGAFDVMPAQK